MRPEPLQVLLDENVPYGVAAWLGSHIPSAMVRHVHDLGFTSRSDEDLHRWAEESAATSVTYDEDFAGQRRFPVGGRCGILRLRVEPTGEAPTCAALGRVLDSMPWEAIMGKLVIVDARRVRLIG